MTTEDRRIRLFNKILTNPDYRKSFVEEHVYTGIPFQVHALRTHEGWTQTELGNKAGMAQARISRIENPKDGEKNNLGTLLEIAHAFRVGLLVRFVPISEILERELNLSPKSLRPLSFDEDPYFQEGIKPTVDYNNQQHHTISLSPIPANNEIDISPFGFRLDSTEIKMAAGI